MKISMIIACVAIISQSYAQASPSKSPEQEKRKAALLECQKLYRDAETSAGLTHQSGTMDEVCLNVGETCTSALAPSNDCVRAKNSLPGTIARSISDRRPVR